MQDRTKEIAGAGWIRVSRGDPDKVWRITWLPRHDRDDLLPAETFSPADPDNLPDDWPKTNDPDDLMRWAVNRYKGMGTNWVQPEAQFLSGRRDSTTALPGA
jgi:hypothetical protein